MTDQPPSQPAGWYYAQGDPPGTQRYWDGTQWLGGPQPVAPNTPPTYDSPASSGTRPRYAENGPRFIAFLIDAGLMIAAYVVVFVMVGIAGAIADALGTLLAIVGFLGVVAFSIYNFLYLQGTTGQTIGKKMQNIKLISATTDQPLGVGMTFVRSLLVAIFAIPCYLDHWWILVDENNQRLSDKVLGNRVVAA